MKIFLVSLTLYCICQCEGFSFTPIDFKLHTKVAGKKAKFSLQCFDVVEKGIKKRKKSQLDEATIGKLTFTFNCNDGCETCELLAHFRDRGKMKKIPEGILRIGAEMRIMYKGSTEPYVLDSTQNNQWAEFKYDSDEHETNPLHFPLFRQGYEKYCDMEQVFVFPQIQYYDQDKGDFPGQSFEKPYPFGKMKPANGIGTIITKKATLMRGKQLPNDRDLIKVSCWVDKHFKKDKSPNRRGTDRRRAAVKYLDSEGRRAQKPRVDGWLCDPNWYADGEYCDCECGIWDPDCDDTLLVVDGCGVWPGSGSAKCLGEEVNMTYCGDFVAPDSWDVSLCPLDYFAGDDGCDCGCGAFDPDCRDGEQEVFGSGCKDMQFYSCDFESGQCKNKDMYDKEIKDKGQKAIPDTWFCDPESYGGGDGCDCECGSYDPDCLESVDPVYGCPSGCEFMTCDSDGFCSGVCDGEFVNATDRDKTDHPGNDWHVEDLYRDEFGEIDKTVAGILAVVIVFFILLFLCACAFVVMFIAAFVMIIKLTRSMADVKGKLGYDEMDAEMKKRS